eukprot:Skav227252  [mRNA]  locus=scaffold1245:58193:59065:- [translate_table: standard]
MNGSHSLQLEAAYVGSVNPDRSAACAVVVALLCELGADVMAKDTWGQTAADYCRGQPELEVAIGAEVLLSCPYLDCRRLYRVRRSDYRCRVGRCGCAVYHGRE